MKRLGKSSKVFFAVTRSISIAAALVGLLFVCLSPAFAQTPPTVSFNAPMSFSAGSGAGSVAVGDFNHDGKPDLAVADSGIAGVGAGVSVLLGNGDGTFQAAASYAAGSQPVSVVVGDFNGDGKLDLVLVDVGLNNLPEGVIVLLGNGDGTFQAGLSYPAGTGLGSIAVGDFNGDGKLDLAVTNQGSGLSVLLGNGNGTFQAPVSYTPGTAPGSVAVGDFNGDGKFDLAVSNAYINNSPVGVSILLGNGNGTFQAPVSYAAGTAPGSIAVGDLNGDGKPDLVVATISGLNVLLGNGNGTFQPAVNYAANLQTSSVVIADFNGDGKPDLAASSGGVSVLLGNGDGTFGAPASYDAALVGGQIQAADFNGDGKPDLAAAHYYGVNILLGNGDGSFVNVRSYTVGSTGDDVVADFNGDGHPDIVVAGYPGNSVSMLLGNGDGTFQPAVIYLAGGTTTSVAAGDFNEDGHLDLAVAYSSRNAPGGGVSILLGNGDGTFQPATSFPVGVQSYVSGSDPGSILVGDFNGDGKLDLAVSDFTGGNVHVLLGNGNGTFQTSVDSPVGATPGSMAVGDFNGDGHPDLVISDVSVGQVSVLLGNGDGTFQAAVNYATGGQYGAVVVGDFNNDGQADLAVADGTNAVSVLLGNGNGTFQPQKSYPAGPQPDSLAVGDFNRDGKSDLAVVNRGAVSVLAGDGDGTFQPPASYSAASSTTGVAVADFNGDGKPDLAVGACCNPALVSILLNASGLGSRLNQAALTVNAPSSATFGSTQTLTTSGGSGTGAVTFGTGVSTACSVNGDQLQITGGTGTCSVTAVKAADLNFDQATSAPLNVTVQKATPIIIFNFDAFGYDGKPHGFGGPTVAMGVNGGVSGTFSYTYTPPGDATQPILPGTYTGTATFTSSDPNYNNATGTDTLTILESTLFFPMLNNANQPVAAFGKSSLSAPMTVAPPVTTGGSNTVAFVSVWVDEGSGAPGTTFNVTATYGGQAMTSAGPTSYDYNYAPISTQVFYLVNPPTGTNTLLVNATASSGTIQEVVANLVSYNGVDPTTPVRPGTYQILHSADGVTVGSFTATIASNTGDLTLGAVEATFTFANPASDQTVDGTAADYFNVGSDHATVGKAVVADTWSFTNPWAFYAYVGFSIKEASGGGGGGTPTLTYTATPVSRSYGTDNPTFTGTVTGFTGTDTQANATTGTLFFVSPAGNANAVGSYAINGAGLTANGGKYVFAQSPSNVAALTITKAIPTVTVTGGTFGFDGNPHAATATAVGFDGNTPVSGSFTSTYTPGGSTVPFSPGTYSVTANFTSSNPNYSNASGTGSITITGSVSSSVTLNNKNAPVAAFGKSSLSTPMTVTPGGSNTVAFATVWVDEGSGASGTTFNVTATYGGQAMTSAGPTSYDYNYAPISTQVFYLVNPPTGTNTLLVNATASSGTIQEVVANLVSYNGVDPTTPVRPGTYQTLHSADGVTVGSFTATIASNATDLTLSAVEVTFTFATPASNQTVDGTGVDYFKVGSDHATIGAPSIADTWSFTNPSAFYAYAGFSIKAATSGGGGSTSMLQSIAVTPVSPSIAMGSTQQFVATGTYSDASTQTITGSVRWASATGTVATIMASDGLATGVGLGTSNITASLGGVTSPVDVLTVTAAVPVTLNNENRIVASFGSSSLSAPMSVTAGGTNTVAFATVWVDEGSGAPGTTFNVTATYGGQAMTSAGPTSYDYNYAPISTQVFYLVNPPTGTNTLLVNATASSGTIQEVIANLVSYNGVDPTTPVRPGTYQTLHSADGVTVGSFTATTASNVNDLTLGAVEATFTFATPASNQTVDGTAAAYFKVGSDHATIGASSVADTWSFTNPWAYYTCVGFSIEAAN